jgi:hypothetical protein
VRRNQHKHDPDSQTDVYWCRSAGYFIGVSVGLVGVVFAVTSVHSLVTAKSLNLAHIAIYFAAGAAFLSFGIGALRERVIVAPGNLTVRGAYTTKRATTQEIRAINYGYGVRGEAGAPYWIPYAELVDGSVIWMTALDGGEISKHPSPLTLDEVRTIRRAMGVGGSDRPDRLARPLWRRGLDVLPHWNRSPSDR